MWETIKYFKQNEFDDNTAPGSGINMNMELVRRLDALRERVNIPLIVNSGYRSPAKNTAVGGVDESAHTRGLAADIRCQNSATRSKILTEWILARPSVLRIGIYPTFIHLDVDPTLPSPVIWVG